MAIKDNAEAKKIFSGYVIYACENKSFRSVMLPEFNSVWVTDGHCSCNFYSEPYDPILAIEKLRKIFSKPKYRKKGWTNDRIEKEIKKILKTTHKNDGGLSEPLFNCLQTYTREVGLCQIHIGWYSGDQNNEGLRIEEILELLISNNFNKAIEIKENVLYKLT